MTEKKPIRKEIIEIGQQYAEHLSREMKLIAKMQELNPNKSEEKYLGDIIFNHPHAKSIPKMFAEDEFVDAARTLYEGASAK